MEDAYAIAWFLVLLASIEVVFMFVGVACMVRRFPEDRRWWQFPAQLAALAVFAIVVLNHPF